MTPDQEKQLTDATKAIEDLRKDLAAFLQTSGQIRMQNFPGDPSVGYEGALAVVLSVLKIYKDGAWSPVGDRSVRTDTETTASSYTVDTDAFDELQFTALADNLTIATSGSPENGHGLIVHILDAGVSKTLTWDPIFASRGANMPGATVAGKWMTIGFKYNDVEATFDCVAYVHE